MKDQQKAMAQIKNNSIDSDGTMYLTIDFMIKIDSIITGPNNIFLRKGNAKPYGFDKMYKDKDLIEKNFCQERDQFNEKIITPNSIRYS